MEHALVTKFNVTFPNNPLILSNIDTGYMGPLSAVTSGVAPACAVTQIANYFSNLGISQTSLPQSLA